MGKKRQRQENSLKKVRDSMGGYAKSSLASVSLLGQIFGERKVLGMIGFVLQPILAVGQSIFGYSVIYTFLYMFAFNFYLLHLAKKMRSGGDR